MDVYEKAVVMACIDLRIEKEQKKAEKLKK